MSEGSLSRGAKYIKAYVVLYLIVNLIWLILSAAYVPEEPEGMGELLEGRDGAVREVDVAYWVVTYLLNYLTYNHLTAALSALVLGLTLYLGFKNVGRGLKRFGLRDISPWAAVILVTYVALFLTSLGIVSYVQMTSDYVTSEVVGEFGGEKLVTNVTELKDLIDEVQEELRKAYPLATLYSVLGLHSLLLPLTLGVTYVALNASIKVKYTLMVASLLFLQSLMEGVGSVIAPFDPTFSRLMTSLSPVILALVIVRLMIQWMNATRIGRFEVIRKPEVPAVSRRQS